MSTNGNVIQQFIIIMLIIVFHPNTRGAFYPKYHTITYSSFIEKLLL